MLVSLLKPKAVPFAQLHARYPGLLELVRVLIGVVPNCDPYLEIWPPAFRTYNVMVPNFLNLPLTVWGLGAPRNLLGLAMYAASRTAGCMYCSAHTCSFALRRGAAPASVARAADQDVSQLPAAERAAIALGRAMSRVPPSGTAEARAQLEVHVSSADAEWIALGVAMMGFLNKFMDALGVELEPETVAEVSALVSPSGWTPGQHLDGPPPAPGEPPKADGFGTKIGVLRHAPSALSLDRKWTRGMPDRWPAVGATLRERTGHDFPLLARITPRRTVRGLATMLGDNLDPATTTTGIPRKIAAGVAYAQTVGAAGLEAQLRAIAAPASDAAVEALARAVAPSPARVEDAIVERCRALAPEAIVEIVTFVSLMQLLVRLESFYGDASLPAPSRS